MLGKNLLALIITFSAALIWLRLMDFAAHRGWVDSQLSRKIIHIGTGPLFVVCWLLFTDVPTSRYLAALVPLSITAQFALVGLGVIKDQSAVEAMSRTGDRREILRGPLYYGIIFVVVTVLYWLETPTGIVALMLVCGGDGMADIIGRRYGIRKLPWNRKKSWMGSLWFFIGGWLLTMLILAVFVLAGVFQGPINTYLVKVTMIALVVTFIESISPQDFDNLTIALASLALGYFLFP
ncbi:MAG: phosphatidate cytidylyltransferase [Chloroflexi bacterium RBG_16_57_11]|nr:MAG: phosphatidate cytidylyltransferase [Chloroflexi bacterium RBG_16_57_11]